MRAFSNPCVLLEDGRDGGVGRLYETPSEILCTHLPSELPRIFDRVEAALRAGRHVAGYFAYEAGYPFEPSLAALIGGRVETPLVWLGVFNRCIDVTGSEDARDAAGRAHAGPLELEWTKEEYAERFARLHDLIVSGELYQANLTFRARFSFCGDPRAFFEDLKRQARAPYCAYIDDGARQILSLSPELFFEITREGVIFAKPMKGTAPRGIDPAGDALHEKRLLASEKERAENLMIVDLMRNDLSRIAQVGSVTVDGLFEIETYPTLYQMVSTARARLKPNMGARDIMRALFPCGSVTGAPKIQAMKAIRSLETSPRGVYCGAIGAFAPDGSARFNVAIRSLVIADGKGELGIGGGVVFDSRSASEYDECLLKARYFERARSPLHLIETLRWSPGGGLTRCERHLMRMERSAKTFGIPFRRSAALRELEAVAASCGKPARIRLALFEDGQFAAQASLLDVDSGKSWRFVFSPVHVKSGDILLRHKTSRRDVFDSEHKRLSRERGADEVLFLNERGEITEGSRSNVFVARDGILFTPALGCGLLDGCLRAELIAEGRCMETVFRPADLESADAIYFGNSLRGLVPAALLSPGAAS